jgi:hypothetical protein
VTSVKFGEYLLGFDCDIYLLYYNVYIYSGTFSISLIANSGV